MHKVQLTFTQQEAQVLSAKAQQLGYNLARYIKLLIGREVLSHIEKYPTFTLSKKAIAKVKKAREDHLLGKTIMMTSN